MEVEITQDDTEQCKATRKNKTVHINSRSDRNAKTSHQRIQLEYKAFMPAMRNAFERFSKHARDPSEESASRDHKKARITGAIKSLVGYSLQTFCYTWANFFVFRFGHACTCVYTWNSSCASTRVYDHARIQVDLSKTLDIEA